MRYSNRKLGPVAATALAVGVAFVIAVAWFIVPRRDETYRDDKVRGGEITSPFFKLLVHVSRPQFLTVFGRTYEGVRGMAPYYFEIPELGSILFVTEDEAGKATVHVVNLQNKSEASIDAGSILFGWGIGGRHKSGDNNADYIECVLGHVITLVSQSLPVWKEVTDVNLDSRRIERREMLRFDKHGKISER